MMKKILTSSVMLPLLSIGLYAAPAFATDDITVRNSNWAEVSNTVMVGATTGSNSADGGNGGDAGKGGKVAWSGDHNIGGNGGNAGDGGMGGLVLTGDATTDASVENHVNTNKTKISNCGCENSTSTVDNILVKNHNHANVGNTVVGGADTGMNNADGGTGGMSGNGASVWQSGDHNTGGNGGDGGMGGVGGGIQSGWATSGASVVNRVNTNVTRIRR